MSEEKPKPKRQNVYEVNIKVDSDPEPLRYDLQVPTAKEMMALRDLMRLIPGTRTPTGTSFMAFGQKALLDFAKKPGTDEPYFTEKQLEDFPANSALHEAFNDVIDRFFFNLWDRDVIMRKLYLAEKKILQINESSNQKENQNS